MASEDYLMIAAGVINVFLSLFVLWIAPKIGLSPQDALTYIVTANGAGGLLTIGKHVLDKKHDAEAEKNGGELEKRVETLEKAVAYLLRKEK